MLAALAIDASSPRDRESVLAARLGDAPLLLAEAKSLIAASDGADDFIEAPVAFLAAARDAAIGALPAETRIGAYAISREIGRGGMGVIYLAHRADGAYQGSVAVKLLQSDIGRDAARFARERQALAGLDHPNIARLLDGGTASIGAVATPYLVMEYVDGIHIDQYCRQKNLTLAKRVRLVQQVCDAVQSAHQRLVVHRDIKPSNILVTHEGTPKLLDFGVARLLEGAEGESASAETQAGGLLFTPRYASPEQVRGGPASVATDVYGVGVLLYEVLAGSSPYARLTSGDTTNTALALRVVAEDPPRRASEVARKAAPADADALTGDLDTILLKACAKDPAERYPTVAALNDDLARWLAGRPITARPPSLHYVVSRFVKRHALGVAVGAVTATLVVASMAAVVVQSQRAERERALAERRFDEIRQFARSMLFDYHDGITQLPGSLAMRERLVADGVGYLDALAATASETSPAAPAARNIALLAELAEGYERLSRINSGTWVANKGRPEEARTTAAKALAIRERLYASEPNNVAHATALAKSVMMLGERELTLGDATQAAATLQRGIALLEPFVAREGLARALPAAEVLAQLYRMENSLDSCAGLNTRGRSREAYVRMTARAPEIRRVYQARFAAQQAPEALLEEAAFLV